ncbi:MAG TPA: site-2 protease family protein [Polyangiaceae bacterium]
MNLSFRLGKIPVRIQPSFFVTAVFFALFSQDVLMIVSWVGIVFVSVMLHELGHATMGLGFGLQPSIDLHGMGGTTSWSASKPLGTARRIAISLAGPFAGFGVAAVVFALGRHVFPPTPLGQFIYDNLLFVNFVWGLVNLLPMLPLDGGNVMRQLLDALTGMRGERLATYVSIIVAALAIPAALLFQSWWGALLAAMFVAMNVRALKSVRAREHDEPMRESLAKAYAALNEKDGGRVLAIARPVALESQSAPVKAEALQLVAFGFLLEGRVADADAALAAMPAGYHPHPSLLELRARTAG